MKVVVTLDEKNKKDMIDLMDEVGNYKNTLNLKRHKYKNEDGTSSLYDIYLNNNNECVAIIPIEATKDGLNGLGAEFAPIYTQYINNINSEKNCSEFVKILVRIISALSYLYYKDPSEPAFIEGYKVYKEEYTEQLQNKTYTLESVSKQILGEKKFLQLKEYFESLLRTDEDEIDTDDVLPY